MNRFSEKDWKLFRRKIAEWQESYMDKLNKEYMEILSGAGNASEKFWKLEKRIKEDKMVSLDLSLTTMAHRYTKDLKPYCQVIPA